MADFGSSPREVLLEGWGLSGELGEPRIGPRRTTWRVGEDLWLASARGPDAEFVKSEAELIAVAGPAAKDAGLALPEVVPTLDGSPWFGVGDRAWRLVTHVA